MFKINNGSNEIGNVDNEKKGIDDMQNDNDSKKEKIKIKILDVPELLEKEANVVC